MVAFVVYIRWILPLASILLTGRWLCRHGGGRRVAGAKSCPAKTGCCAAKLFMDLELRLAGVAEVRELPTQVLFFAFGLNLGWSSGWILSSN